MLREYFTLEEFSKIFQEFNDAVYRGDAKKLPYKSWRNINSWRTKGEYEKIQVSKELVRRANNNDNPYEYREIEIILVKPWDSERACPNPEELNPNDGSFGSWLDGVLARESLITLDSYHNDTNEVAYTGAYTGATVCNAIVETGRTVSTTMSDALKQLQSNICTLNDTSDVYYYPIDTDWINTSSPRYELKSDSLYIDGKSFNEYFQTFIDTEKENKTMKFNFDFGPVDSSVRMSLYGMAIKNASGTYVAYDENSKSIMDVDILNFEGANKFIYKVPVALKEVRCGDVIIHSRKPMFVQAAYADGRFKVLDVFDGEEKTIVPARSPFGFDFMTKVVSLCNFNGTADASNPFGNMLPLMMLSDSKTPGDRDMLLMYVMMSGNTNFATNPMMLYALMDKDGKTSDMLPFLLMGNCGFGAQPTGCSGNCSNHECDCGKNNSNK